LLRLADESSPAARADALYQIAEINAVREDALGEALEQLDAALEAEPRFERACAILRAALDASPESDAALAAYERVARRANDRDVLLDMFERKASAPGATPESLREGVEVAMATDARERAGALLERIVDIARSSNDGLAGHTWAPLQLIELRMSDGELQTAATLVMELCQLAGVDAVWTLATQLAEQARGDGKLDIAGQLLQMLRDYRPDAREVWEPLFRLYMEQHEYEALEHLAGQTVLSLVDVSERNALRMLYGEFLEQDPDRKRAALETYKDVLLDEPGHSGAAARLEAMIEETGTPDEIVAFLTQRFDDARDRGDADTIADAALRLGARLSDSDPYEAVAVYRSAAELAPGNAAVLQALIDLLADSADPGELADWKEKLLAVSHGDDAEPLALDVYALRNDAGDAAGALRALEAGRAVAPESEKLLAALQSWYRDNGKMRPLAELLAAEAERLDDPTRSVELLSEVTSIYRDMLMDPVGAIDAIRKAATIAPQDMGLLSELVRTLLAQGDTAAAIAETEAALERGIDDDSDRADVLLSQAEARLSAGDAIRAIDDIERAYAIDADRALPTFGPALKAARNQARDEGDFEQERAATLRFAELHRAHGNPTACRQVLEAWLDMQPEDTGAMALLCDLHEAEQDWHALMVVCGRLALRSEGDEQLASAHRLAEATAKVEDSSAARGALELVFAEHPDDRVLSGALRGVYERTGANSELAALIRHDADQTDDDDERLALLLRAADLLIASDAPADAVPVLERARALDPGDQGVALRFIDALVATGQLAEARAQLEPLAKTATKKRSAASSRVMQRLARLCLAEGDTESGLKWLEKSFDINRSDGHLAADVARIAVEQRSYPLAIKALRTISLKKLDGPISVEQAIVDEGKIELALGNPAKARMLANKVLRSDPTFAPAQQLLELVKQ
jgi:tetratricopeptide (TPR) repeat protein